VKEVQHTLGILGYQHPFVERYAQLTRPLTELTWKEVPFCWEEQHTQALDHLINLITTAPVLKCPNLEKQYFLEVDASSFALGMVLFQKDEKE